MWYALKCSITTRYHWWLVGIGIAILAFAGNGFISSFFQIWWSEPLGSDGLMTWITTSGLRANLVLALVAAIAVDRFGSRPALLVGLALCAGAGIANVLAPVSVWTIPLIPLLAIGLALGTNVPVLYAINDWFDRFKPLAIAILLATVEVLNFFAGFATAWPRASTLIFGLLILVVGLPLATRVRRRAPGPYALAEPDQPQPDETEQQRGRPTAPEYGWNDAVRSREFWLLVIASGCLAAVGQVTRTMIFPIADFRFDVDGSYLLFERPYDIVSVLFLVVGGLAGMRMRLRNALFIFAIAHLVAVVVIIVATSTWWLFVAVIILGAGQGGAGALKIAAIGSYFGRSRFATLLASQGLLVGIGSLLAGVAPLFVSNLADNPTWAFALATIPAIVGVGAYGKLGDPKPPPIRTAGADVPS